MAERRRKHWGWGYEDQAPPWEQVVEGAAAARAHLGFEPAEPERPVPLEEIELPEPRLRPPAPLAALCSDDLHDRVSHALGKAYRDVVRAMRGQVEAAPDLVARPETERDVEELLAWAVDAGAAVIPYGGGTSVVGGVEPRGIDRPVLTMDLGRLDRVLEVDATSRAARIQAGALGPHLEEQLREHGLTLRCFPQSFELSSLGGWIATRAGGHWATGRTHVDDLVESIRAITPSGAWESARLPASGAGPSPDRMLLGSEGTLGIITEAWMRVVERPRWKASCGVRFESLAQGAEGVRAILQSGLQPDNCRLLDEAEAELTGALASGKALLVLGFESSDHPVDALMDTALEVARSEGGEPGEVRRSGDGGEGKGDSVSTWRDVFLQAPYLRDTLVCAGVLVETFETAITWDRFGDLYADVVGRVHEATREACGAEGRVTCRFTHVYPDGPAPYFTVLAPAPRGREVEAWDEIKARASDVLRLHGATITHHHAVGRDHRPWYDRQRPDPFARALAAAKDALDPGWALNPGVLVDPPIR